MALKILYVEDNPLNLRLVRRMLMPDGYVMIDASLARQGIELATKTHPNLILMDMNLPDMEGMDAVKIIKATPNLMHIPIIALTANSMCGDREYCLSAGCDGYIAKPISRKELLNVVTYFINRDMPLPVTASGNRRLPSPHEMERPTTESPRFIDSTTTQEAHVAAV